MDHLLVHDAAVRPWRLATIVAIAVATVELVLLVVAGFVLIARPISDRVQERAAKKPAAAAPSKRTPVVPKPEPVRKPTLTRAKTSVLVLNGNGRTGAASLEATLVRSRGYSISSIANAKRATYARSVVMYRPGFRAEGARLAKDLGISMVSPLDGLKPAALGGAKVAVIVGDD